MTTRKGKTKTATRHPGRDELLALYEPVVQAIAATFGTYCEVVLHSLEDYDNSIISIANGAVTGRSVGAPVTDFAAQLLKKRAWDENGVVANYTTRTDDGRLLKSTTVVIRDADGEPVAMLCINMDTSAPASEFVREIFGTHDRPGGDAPVTNEHFPTTARDLIEISLRQALDLVNEERGLSPVERNRAIVQELDSRGVFNVKNAVDIVAEDLGISRYTVYNYIRDVRGKTE